MARMDIPGVGIVQFPDTMSRDEMMSRAEAMQAQASKPLLDPRELGAGQLLKGGFSRGIEGLKGTALDLIPALGGALFSRDEYARGQLKEFQDRMAAQEELTPTAYKGFKDIQGIGDFGGFVAETVGEVAPDIASFFLGAGAGTVIGKGIAKKSAAAALKDRLPEQVAKRQLAEEAATKLEQRVLKSAASQGASIGSTVGLFGTSMGQSIPETLNSIYEETGNLAPGLAITFGSLKGALDTYLPSKILKQLGPAGKDRVAAAMLDKSDLVPVNFKRAFLTELAKTSGGEAITEATQQAIDIVAGQVAGGTDPFFSPKNIDNILFAGLKGAVGGGTFGAPGAAMEASRAKSAAAAEINRRAQAGEITQEQQQQQLLLLENKSFTPVALPDGTVVMTQEELDAYEQRQFDNKFAPQDVAPLQLGMSTPTIPVDSEGVAYPNVQTMRDEQANQAAQAEQQAFEARTAPQDVEGYQPDLFPQELELAQAQEAVQGLSPTIDQALAGPPEAPAEFKTVLDADSLKGTGLTPQSGFYKKLLNKDIADPTDQAAVRNILVQVRTNPNLSESTKQAVESLALQAFGALGQQTNVVGPRGGIRRDANYGRNQPRSPVSETNRESVQVPSESVREESTAGTGELGQEGVAPTGSTTSEPGDGKALQSGTLIQDLTNFFKTRDELNTRYDELQAAYDEADAKYYDLERQGILEGDKYKYESERDRLKAEKQANSKERDLIIDQLQKLKVPTQSGTLTPTPTDTPTVGPLTQKALDAAAAKEAKKVEANRLEAEEEAREEAREEALQAQAEADVDAGPIGQAIAKIESGEIETKAGVRALATKLEKNGVLDDIEDIKEGLSDRDQGADDVLDTLNSQLDDARDNAVSERVDELREEFEQTTPAAPKVKDTPEKNIAYLRSLEDALEDSFDPAEIRALTKEIVELKAKLGVKGKAQVGAGTGMFRGDVTKLAKDLRAALNKMGLGKVAINLEKVLFDADGKPVQGFYNNKLIQIALRATDPTYTLNHEALHAMRELGFFSPADWNALSSMAKSTWMKKYDIAAKYPNLDKESQIEEAVTEAFATFQQQPPKTQSILAKVINNLRRLGNFLRGYGFKVADDVFGKAASGQLARDRANIIEEFNNYLDTIPNGEVKYQVAAQKQIFTGVDKVIRAVPNLSNTQKAVISEGIKIAGDTSKSIMLSLLPMHALGEVADGVFPRLGTTFNRLINQRSGYQDTLNRGIDAVITEAKRAITANPEQHKAFDKLVNTSTVEEVDPTSPRDKYKDDPDKLATWNKLDKEYRSLKPPLRNLYVTMRDGYKQMYEEVKKAITTRIDDTDLDAATKKSVKDSVLLKLSEQGMIEPYFGLGREGSYWLAADYKDKSGQQQTTVEAFKSDYERKTRMEQLQAMGATRIEPYANIAAVNYRRAPSGSFVNSVLNILEANKPKDGVAAERFDKAIDEMMRLFLTTLPETAFAQSFQKRKGTAGYMEDTIGVFERKMRNTAHQVSNMVYSPKLTGVVDQMREQTAAAGASAQGNALQKEYLSEFEKHLGYVLNPTKNDIGSILTSAAFTYTLGFNVSSALVNMANIPMIVAPYLKGRYGDASVASAIGNATSVFTGSGTKTNMPVIGADGRTTAMRVMPSITNYAPDSAIGKRYATLIRIGNEQGQFNRSQLYEILNADTRTGVMAKFNAISGWMFHHGERMNREVTLISTYNLELERLKKQGITGPEAEAEAAQTAIYTTELTNGGISAAAAPRIAQNSIGKVFFMYKRYGISMYYMMFKTAKEALKGETPEIRQAAMKQLGGIVGMSALMAGAQGIPMYGALSLVYSLFTDEDEDDLDAVTQKALGDFLYKGPVEYLTNLSIAGRITLNDLIIRDAPQSNASTFTQQVIQAIGGPVFGVVDRVSRGYSKINEGNFERGIEDLLPSAFSNAFKAVRYGSEGTKTLRGDPITGEVSMFNAVGQALGFAPADYTRQVEINAREKGIDKTISTRASKQKQKYYMAKRENDSEGMADAKEKLLEIGAKHPGLEITPGNVTDVLNRSIKAQERATKDMINGARYNKKRLEEIKASLAEYED